MLASAGGDLFIPALMSTEAERSHLEQLIETVAVLRSPQGCPWDREQTHASLTRHLISECAELVEAIDREDFDHMCEELGDVLLQVVLHAQIASEEGLFDFEAVSAGINEKLIRRHPHVFGDEETRRRLDTSEKVLVEWEKIKASEKVEQGKPVSPGPFKPLPPVLPALLYASEACKQLERAGLEPLAGTAGGGGPAAEGDLSETQLGDALFAWVAAARRFGLDPEAALRRAAASRVERAAEEIGPGL